MSLNPSEWRIGRNGIAWHIVELKESEAPKSLCGLPMSNIFKATDNRKHIKIECKACITKLTEWAVAREMERHA